MAVVLMGIVLGQAVLYGPSLVGRKILLPLDLLGREGVYLPKGPEIAEVEIQNVTLGDLIYVFEPARQFAVSEVRSGRLPMWAPYEFSGVPFIWPKFSPLLALGCVVASPVVLAWIAMLAAMVGGVGAYVFFRRVLHVGFWPAAICASCYPLTGFFVFWQGYPTGLAVYWLPWILLAVDHTVRGTSRLAPVGLCAATCLVVVSGHLDVAGLVLVASSLYAVWCFWDTHRNDWLGVGARGAVAKLFAGWVLGLMLAAPYVLPVSEYSASGHRAARRAGGEQERPPGGISELPRVVLPDMYGSWRGNAVLRREGAEAECSGAAYAGVVATLMVAPLGFCARGRRSMSIVLGAFAFLGVAWCLNVPGWVDLMGLPGLHLLSWNRFTFATAFAVLAMAALGLEALSQSAVRWRWWFWFGPAVLGALVVWSAYQATVVPGRIEWTLQEGLAQGQELMWWLRKPGIVERVGAWFLRSWLATAVWCGLGLAGWLWLWWGRGRALLVPVLGAVLVGDLLWFGYGRSAQCDPALYFPPIPALEQVSESAPGRVIGCGALPANLAEMCGLRDVRGYDGVDPRKMVDLLTVTMDRERSVGHAFALTQELAPKMTFDSDGKVRLPPLLDMLGVRYVILREPPPAGVRAEFESPDYWVLVNHTALERVFIPRRVEVERNDEELERKLSSPQFDSSETAYLESGATWPSACEGKAQIVEATPTRIKVSLRMTTPGLVVLADSWDKGWRAYANGKSVPILRTNHALRGVVVPAGPGTLEFRYKPASFVWGLALSGAAAIVVLMWSGVVACTRHEA